MTRTIIYPIACLAALALAACSGGDAAGPAPEDGDADTEATVFLTQDVPSSVTMEALYAGKVNRDADGCLRVESEGGALVIWPYGFRLVGGGNVLHVKNARGKNIGRIGGSFRMSGGYVPSGSFERLSGTDRQRAQTRCPSTHYWVVGDAEA